MDRRKNKGDVEQIIIADRITRITRYVAKAKPAPYFGGLAPPLLDLNNGPIKNPEG